MRFFKPIMIKLGDEINAEMEKRFPNQKSKAEP
jgi:hypothetical protein